MLRRIATVFAVGSFFVFACGTDNDGQITTPEPKPDASVFDASSVAKDSGGSTPGDATFVDATTPIIEGGVEAGIDASIEDAGMDAEAGVDAGTDAGADANDGGLTGAAVFCKKYYDAATSGLSACCPGEVTLNLTFAVKLCGDALDAEVTKGKVVYDAAKEASCLTAIQYLKAECPASGPAKAKTSADCDQAYRGLVAEGGTCAGDVECADGLPCQGTICKKATTVAGGDCDTADGSVDPGFPRRKRCIDGEICYSDNKCGPLFSKDHSCRDDEDCLSGLYCQGKFPGATCQPLVKQPSGGSCESDLNCDTDLTCQKANASDTLGTCAPRKVIGTACTDTTLSTTECFGVCSPTTHQCVAFCGSK